LDWSVAMEKNKIQNKQNSVMSIKWLCVRCGNCGYGWWRVPDDVLEEASAARYS
jgi:hypothetical protein